MPEQQKVDVYKRQVPKREMLAKFGISLPEFAEFVSVNMAGEVVSQVYEEGKAVSYTHLDVYKRQEWGR